MIQSSRVAAVQPPCIPIVAELIRAHPGTISLGQGVVHYGPPPAVHERIKDFFADPQNHKYKAVDGIPQLKEALAAKLAAKNKINLDAATSLVVTAGGNMAFVNALLAIADPGDEIVLLTPYYFNQEMAVRLANCVPICVPTNSNFHPDLDRIQNALSPRTRAIVTISPNNPTGAVYREETLRAINSLCAQRNIFHISDEAYEDFVYAGAKTFSPASIPNSAPHTISLFSLSKSHGFASWRIGYMLISANLLDAVKKIQDTILICPPVVSQIAADGALREGADYVRTQIASIESVRTDALNKLRELPPRCRLHPSDGALYFFLTIDANLKPMQLVERLIRDHRVAVMPGDAFGAEGCSIRVSFGALNAATVHEGIGRLVMGLRTILA